MRGVLLVVMAALLTGCLGERGGAPGPPPAEGLRLDTEVGSMTILLYRAAAPETVRLMEAYVEEGYFVGREFSRVVPTHVIQVVDRMNGATEDGRRVPLETHPAHRFSAGALGIARGEAPDSGGPEFFIMDFATSHLHERYTVWGQVVEGLDVVRRIARVEAVDLRPATAVPVAGEALLDRMAVRPVRITGMTRVTLDLPADVLARYPLVVPPNQRTGDWRHSLEWPRDLSAGAASDLTWYVRAYNGTTAPHASAVTVRLAGADLPVQGDPLAPGAYRFSWTPPAPGRHEATLIAGGTALGTLVIDVPHEARPAR